MSAHDYHVGDGFRAGNVRDTENLFTKASEARQKGDIGKARDILTKLDQCMAQSKELKSHFWFKDEIKKALESLRDQTS